MNQLLFVFIITEEFLPVHRASCIFPLDIELSTASSDGPFNRLHRLFLVHTNIEESHPGATPLLMLGAIGVARSYVPGNLCPVDKTIEETFMRHAKSKSGAGGSGVGVSGLLSNYEAYKRWALTAHERSRYLDVMLQTVDMADESSTMDRHRDTRPSQIRKIETATEKVMEAVGSFLNPFEMNEPDLHCIVSGAPVPVSVMISWRLKNAERRRKWTL